jgi:hypothetical protein
MEKSSSHFGRSDALCPMKRRVMEQLRDDIEEKRDYNHEVSCAGRQCN